MAELAPIVIGLGAANGYSGADLSNARDAAQRGELPYLRAGEPITPLELRIHGVGGAPSTENLETPATLQVSGDATAGFFRAWFPGGTAAGQPHREAYCWGGLNTRGWTRALWLLLIPFMLVNVAYWALPRLGAGWFTRLARVCLRLLGLTLTVAFTGTAVTLLCDIVAVQGAGMKALPSWLGSYQRLDIGPRQAIALLVVLALVALIVWISVQTTRAYEKWDGGEGAEFDEAWPMTHPHFWRGERTVSRQRYCHVAAVGAELAMFGAVSAPHGSLRTAIIAAAGVIGALSVLLIISDWTERSEISGRELKGQDKTARVFGYGALGLAAAVAIARFWWGARTPHVSLPADQALQTVAVFTEFGLVVPLLAAVAVQAPWSRPGVMARGFVSPLLALFAACIATIFGSSITLTVTNLIGSPTTGKRGKHASDWLLLPSTVFAGGAGMLVALGGLIAFGLVALVSWARKKARWSDSANWDSVAAGYPAAGGKESQKKVAGVWAVSSLTDLAALAIGVISVPTAALLIWDEVSLTVDHRAINGLVRDAGTVGGTVGVLVVGFFLVQLRSALTNASARKRFGVLWDVGTFWPRACHPFAPPCYAERSIPEVVTRVRRIAGDMERGPCDPAVAQQDAEAGDPDAPRERQRPVLITGYSQGTPISVAAIAQLPPSVRSRVALLTLAAPVRRLYGRAFPAYFGPLDVLERQLTDGPQVRWRNTVRRSDYIGGWALRPVPTDPGHPLPRRRVDHEIYDPPSLWGDQDPTPPPAHLHLVMFSDPQTRPYADELLAMLPTAPPRPPTMNGESADAPPDGGAEPGVRSSVAHPS